MAVLFLRENSNIHNQYSILQSLDASIIHVCFGPETKFYVVFRWYIYARWSFIYDILDNLYCSQLIIIYLFLIYCWWMKEVFYVNLWGCVAQSWVVKHIIISTWNRSDEQFCQVLHWTSCFLTREYMVYLSYFFHLWNVLLIIMFTKMYIKNNTFR